MLVPTTILERGSSGALVRIEEIDLTSTQAFTGIPGNYSDLRVVLVGRGDAAAATVVANLRFNGDSGANYESNLMQSTNNTMAAAATASQTEGILNVFPAASATASRAGIAVVEIPEYAGTAFHKIVHSAAHAIHGAGAADYISQVRGFQWRNTAAITRIDVVLSSGAWTAGSVARLYGVT